MIVFLHSLGKSHKTSLTVLSTKLQKEMGKAKQNYFRVRDRPFNLQGFFFRSEFFFSDNTRVRILFFFQNLTLG